MITKRCARANRARVTPSLPRLAGEFRLLADPTRLKILESLLDGVQCNCNIKDVLGLPMNLISHHLKILKKAGLVSSSRDAEDARWIYYQIEPKQMAAFQKAISAALDPARMKPRGDTCGPPICCQPPKRERRARANFYKRSKQ